jgi:ribosomal protein S27AE
MLMLWPTVWPEEAVMPKEHIAIRCPRCGRGTLTGWPTPHVRQLRVKCPACEASFLLAEAVERTVIGAADDRDLYPVQKQSERSD